MAIKLDHIAIATNHGPSLQKIIADFTGVAPSQPHAIPAQGVFASFVDLSNASIELISPTSPDTNLQKYLDKKGTSLHHLAFLSDDIEADISRLKALGYTPLSDHPSPGAKDKMIVFFHPKTTGGILIELCQKPSI